jgi:GDP-D-mannose dehydratase
MSALSPTEKSARVALITGASSGIGQACAAHLASRGWRVFGTSRKARPEPAAAGGVEMIPMDVDDDDSVEQGVAMVLERAGSLDAVARLVERILNHSNPKLHYPVGMLSQRIVIPLKSYLPQRMYEWLAWRLLRL